VVGRGGTHPAARGFAGVGRGGVRHRPGRVVRWDEALVGGGVDGRVPWWPASKGAT
jgi:hypothetical protein